MEDFLTNRASYVLTDNMSSDLQGIESTRIGLSTVITRLIRIYNAGKVSLDFLERSLEELSLTTDAIIDGLLAEIKRQEYSASSVMIANLANSNKDILVTPLTLKAFKMDNLVYSELESGVIFESSVQSTIHSED